MWRYLLWGYKKNQHEEREEQETQHFSTTGQVSLSFADEVTDEVTSV